MGPDEYKKVKEVFDVALEVDPDRRDEYIAEACNGDTMVSREVARLLNSFEEEFLESPAVANFADEITAGVERVGQTIAHYHLLEMLGSGGMGEVYLAEDGKLGRKVAIKVLPDEFTSDEDRLNRFGIEARSASALNHPNILTIYEIGESKDTHYIATEFVDGETLRQRLFDERFSIQESLECGVQLAAAITAAHEAGITHRDIKPENIMIRGDGLLKVLDFGIAKHAAPASVAVSPSGLIDEPTIRMLKTEPGVIMGTLQYMSPEQARGIDTDARTDIWSLGCVLYEMLCGRAPFCGDTPADLIAEIVKSPAPPVKLHCPGVPERLEEIVAKALEKNQPDRYQTARDLLNDLKRLQKKIDANPELSRAGLLRRRLRPKGLKKAKPKRTSEKDLATVSSAEYLIWGIKAHRFTTAGIVLLILALLGGTAFVTRRYWAGPNEARMNYGNKIRLAAQALEGTDLQQVEQILDETKPDIGEDDLRSFEWGYLAELLEERSSSQPVTLWHENAVDTVAFSPDGTKLATGGSDSYIHLWDVSTGEKLSTLTGHTDRVVSVSFSPDGKRLLSGGADRTARLWDVDSHQLLMVLEPDYDPSAAKVTRLVSEASTILLVRTGGSVSHPFFTQNGSSITAIGGNSIRSWDANTGKEAKVLVDKVDEHARFALSPDERTIAVRMADQSISLRNASTGKTFNTLKDHSGLVTDIRFSHDSKTILAGSTDGTAKAWDVRTGKNLRTLNHSGEIYGVAFSPDGKMFATCGSDDTVKLWDSGAGYQLATLKGHRGHVQALTFSQDGRRIASGGGGGDSTAKIWNVPIGEPRGVLRGHGKSVGTVVFSPDGETLLSTGGDKTSRLWSVNEERQRISLPDTGSVTYSSQGSIAFYPRGKEIAIGGENAIRIWDLSSGKARKSIPVAGWATLLTYSNDGEILVFSHGGSNKVIVWDTTRESEVCSFNAHKPGPSYISFTKDGKIVTSSLSENRVLVWDAKTCNEAGSFTGGTEAGFITSSGPDGQILALEVMNLRSLRLISIVDGEEIASFSGHEGALSDAKFSPNGNRLATSSRDGTIKIWDLKTSQELLTIKPGAGAIESIAFSPNGEVLAAACGDGTIRLFRSRISG